MDGKDNLSGNNRSLLFQRRIQIHSTKQTQILPIVFFDLTFYHNLQEGQLFYYSPISIIKIIRKAGMMNLKLLQRRAKETLEFLSNHDQSFSWNTLENDYQPRSIELKAKKPRQGAPSEQRNRARISTADFTGKNIKNLIVPRVITFEEAPNSMRETIVKTVQRRDPRKKHSLSSNRTLSGIESAVMEQEIEGIDFMKFWVRHRFEEKSIDSLVSQIESKRRKLREMRG